MSFLFVSDRPVSFLYGSLVLLCLTVDTFLDFSKLTERSRSYRSAAIILTTAIARYEVSVDRPESTLTEAAQKAAETPFSKGIPWKQFPFRRKRGSLPPTSSSSV